MGTSSRGVVPSPMSYNPRRDPRTFEVTMTRAKDVSDSRLYYVEAKSSLEAGAIFINRFERMGQRAPKMEGIREL